MEWDDEDRESPCSYYLRNMAQLLEKQIDYPELGSVSLIAMTYSKHVKDINDKAQLQSLRTPDLLKILFKKSRDQHLNMTDLSERFRILLQIATEFIFFQDVQKELPQSVENFSIAVFEMLLNAFAQIIRIKTREPKSVSLGWEQMVLICEQTVVTQFIRVMNWLVSPPISYDVTVRSLKMLVNSSPEWQTIITVCVKKYKIEMYRYSLFLHNFRYKYEHNDEILTCVMSVLQILDKCGLRTLPAPPKGKDSLSEWSVVVEENKKWQDECVSVRQIILRRLVQEDRRYFERNNLAFSESVDYCAIISPSLQSIRYSTLKICFSRIKNSQCKHIKFTNSWFDLTETLTHEEATWYSKNSSHNGWKIDATEGPIRQRKRLVKCRQSLPSKFLLDSLDESTASLPLHNLLLDEHMKSALARIVESINDDEKILRASHASFIAPTVERVGEFLISKKCFYFIGEESLKDQNAETRAKNVVSRCWPVDSIVDVLPRRFRLQDCAIELFTTDGQSAFLSFQSKQEKLEVFKVFSDISFPSFSRSRKLNECTTLWREGTMTNFEYLTCLNKFGGRSFNDLMQYPVFPFILNDYDSQDIDLQDKSIYRNLMKPVPLQSPDREQHFIDHYEATLQMNSEGPYHYSSHYSNASIVLYYMIRVSPFTELFLKFQDGNFDVPDRSFYSLATTWQLTSSDSTTAIRELIPEFFFLPEMFLNMQGLDLGIRQNGDLVRDVLLPPWCNGDPRIFVLVHRAALESEQVSRDLQHWIDLVFGFKQCGKAAVKAINVFHPATYFGFNVDEGSEDDQLTVEARKTMIKTYGQTPKLLFQAAHPHLYSSSLNQLKISTTNVGDYKVINVLDSVKGISWGLYAGSPSDPAPRVRVERTLEFLSSSIVVVSSDEIVLVHPNCVSFVVPSNKEQDARYVIGWRSSDNVIRVKKCSECYSYPLVSLPSFYKVTFCVTTAQHLWLGTNCGHLMVYAITLSDSKLFAHPINHPLMGHSGAINCMTVSSAFKVCLSAGSEGVVVLWDTNRMNFVRRVKVTSGITDLAISETLGDWVAAVNDTNEAHLFYYTLNGVFINRWQMNGVAINSVTFSNAPEGRNVNVIAAALSDRTVRLFSSWDLKHVRTLETDLSKGAGICLMYSMSNYHLMMITDSQRLVVWENSKAPRKDLKFSSTGVVY